jgi:hypothetical protein
MMRLSTTFNTLKELGVHFVVPQNNEKNKIIESPVSLLSNLASSNEARVRLALIPLFIQHPDYSQHVQEALKHLAPPQQKLLRCYYTAAQLLQKKYRQELEKFLGQQNMLPTLFEEKLKLDNKKSPDFRLHQLAQKQARLSGKPINWYGTYEHAYTRLERHTKARREWQ